MNASLFFILTWTFLFFHVSVCLKIDHTEFYLENTVFVAFAGEDLSIGGSVIKRQNQSADAVTCSDPFNKLVVHHAIPAVDTTKSILLTVKLKRVTLSGEYVCQYHKTKVFWFLHVRTRGYMEPRMSNTKFIPVAIVTAVLLVFSVAGSVYVFRGNWKEQITKCGKTGGTQNQIREERKTRETEEDAEIVTAPSASFYCSLQPRPRSIYDVLDHSGADKDQDQRKTKPDKTEPPNMIQQTTQLKDEDVFESVYENF